MESFNGNYSYMRVLKYFIIKQETVADEYGNASVETISQLADFKSKLRAIENINDYLITSDDETIFRTEKFIESILTKENY